MSKTSPHPDAVEILEVFVNQIEHNWPGSFELLDYIDDELWRIEDSLYDAGEDARREFLRVPDYLRRDVGYLPLLELAEVAQASVHLFGKEHHELVPEDVRYVFMGLAVRAIATMREIALLLEGGFAFGARSRWRTLSEILVVAKVLTAGNRYTATRYKEHRWVMLARQRRRSMNFAWESNLATPEVMEKRLVRRFGKSYKEEYGWAARVVRQRFPQLSPKAKLEWKHLKEIARVNDIESRILAANHSVHADALGFLGTVSESLGLFHAGASSEGVIEVARDSVRLFREVISSLFDNLTKFTGNRNIEILQAIMDVHAFNHEVKLKDQHIMQDEHVRNQHFAAMQRLFSDLTEHPVTD